MWRILATSLLGWALVLTAAGAGVADTGGDPGGDPGRPPDWCFEMNDRGELPTCTSTSDGGWERSYPSDSFGDGVPGWFVALFVLGALIGVAITVYRVSIARQMARDSGMSTTHATAMTLLEDDGLEATYLATNLRTAIQPSLAHPAGTAPAARTVEERLAELAALRDKGLVTQAEYDERRAAILGSL